MSPIQILIVEDEKLVANDLRETLEFLGYKVPWTTTTAEDAIARLETMLVDVVLMDIRLAGAMDGIEASRIIQSEYKIPVVYLTANTDLSTLERVKSSQPFGYILKPFREKTLATTIEIAVARHQAEMTVYRALEAAQARQHTAETQLQQKSDYLHLVAHELRNPLTAIKFAAEVLNQENIVMPDERRQSYIQRIHAATKSLNELLEDVLLLERSAAIALECCAASIRLEDFCHQLVEALQLSADDYHQIVFRTVGESRLLCLDEKLMWHLLSNLLSNAVKYSPAGGVVSLVLTWHADQVELRVIDQGIGIPAETQAKLFQPFQRGSNVGAIPGTGLGLAIAKRCTELQGGTISLESEVGQGSSFIVVFPA
jgi:signal transduction histidine kinase